MSKTTSQAACLLAFALLCGNTGCGSVSRGEFNTLQTQNRVLSEQNHAQAAEIANLREHQRKLEDLVIRQQRDSLARSASSDPRP